MEGNILTQENIYKTLLVFDEFFDKMSKEDKRRVLENLIAEVQLYPSEKNDASVETVASLSKV